MNCAQVADRLELFVLGDLPRAEHAGVEAHLRACPCCRAAEVACRALVGRIRRAGEAMPLSPGLERLVRQRAGAAIGLARRRRRRRLTLTASVAALLLVGLGIWHVSRVHDDGPLLVTASASADPRPSTPDPPPAPAPVVLEIWRREVLPSVPASVSDGVVVCGSRMYLALRQGAKTQVAALDASTGSQRWLSAVRGLGHLAADADRVYGVASGGRGQVTLVALDAADGHAVWRCSRDTTRRLWGAASPVLLPGRRVCWAVDATLTMLDATNGQVVWTRPIPDHGLLSPAAAMGADLYVVSGGWLYCLDVATGRPRWHKAFDDVKSGWTRPLLAARDGRIYIVQRLRNGSSRMMCMGSATRRLVWSRAVPQAVHLLAAGRQLYLRARDVLAYDTTTGDLAWVFNADGCGPMTWADGVLHFVDSGRCGRLVALDASTGERVWEMTGMRSCDAFIRTGNTGYLKTGDGVVHAFALCRATPY